MIISLFSLLYLSDTEDNECYVEIVFSRTAYRRNSSNFTADWDEKILVECGTVSFHKLSSRKVFFCMSKIAYYLRNKRCLLFLHGLKQTKETFGRTREQISARSRVAPAARGHFFGFYHNWRHTRVSITV